MKLGKKNLLYSIFLVGILLIFLLGYFIYMLPSLYVDYMMEQNLESVKEQHKAYMESGSYDKVRVNNAMACFSVKVPNEGNSIYITGKAFSAEFSAKDDKLRSLLKNFKKQIRDKTSSWEDKDNAQPQELKNTIEELAGIIKDDIEEEDKLPFKVNILSAKNMENDYRNETIKLHIYSGNMIVAEAGIEESGNKYTNYVAIEQDEDSVVFSVLPAVTPEMNEIRSVVMGSLPMLGAVVLLVVLLFSQVYSKGIVMPIVELVNHAEEMKDSEGFDVKPLDERWKWKGDEVGELADTLDGFYLKTKESYEKLEEDNKRKEIFLRASAHQLKTPIAASLLLMDGMINEVGKYKDVKAYLPDVKKQLLSMRKMTEDILYLNKQEQQISLNEINVGKLVKEQLKSYIIAAENKKLVIELAECEKLAVCTDEIMVSQILDNLISNAVKYTPKGGRMKIRVNKDKIVIKNFGSSIPDNILNHIFEPFVSGDNGGRGHGLGLYIASYYAGKLNINISIDNMPDGVKAVLVFADKIH